MRTLNQILTKRITAGKLRPLCFIRTARCGKTADHRLRGLFGRCRAGRVETNQQRSERPSQSHLSGVIGLAMLYTLFYPDEKRLRELWKPTLLYMSLMAALFFWSMVIWIESFAAVSSMIRSCSKIVFQSIAILTAVALVYLFREKPSSCLPSASALPTRPSCC